MDEQWLVIRNGKVIDTAGGNRPPLQQDVIIRNSRIVSVGNDAVERSCSTHRSKLWRNSTPAASP